MTLKESIEKTAGDLSKIDPTDKARLSELKTAVAVIMKSNNRLISSAEKQKTRMQKYAYESSPMRKTRDKGSEFYLPSGRFTIKGVPQTIINNQGDVEINPEYIRLAQNARGFSNLKTVRGRGAVERVDKMRERLRNVLATENAAELVDADKYRIVGSKGIFTGATLKGPLDITPDKFLTTRQYEAAQRKMSARNREIESNIRKVDAYIKNMSPDEVSDMYSEYRRYLDWLKANRQSKEYKDYEANNDNYTPEKVFAGMVRANLGSILKGDPIAGWSDRAIQEMVKKDVQAVRDANAANAYASRTVPKNATEAAYAAGGLIRNIRSRKTRR